MALQMAAYLVVAISQPVGEEAAFGIQQQAAGLGGAGGDHHNICKLLLQVSVSVEVSNATRASPVVGKYFLHHALAAQFAVPGIERDGDYGVLRAVFCIRFADISVAPPATHAGTTPVVGHAIAAHGNLKRMEAEPLRCRRSEEHTS